MFLGLIWLGLAYTGCVHFPLCARLDLAACNFFHFFDREFFFFGSIVCTMGCTPRQASVRPMQALRRAAETVHVCVCVCVHARRATARRGVARLRFV